MVRHNEDYIFFFKLFLFLSICGNCLNWSSKHVKTMFSHLSQIIELFLCYFRPKFCELIHSNTNNAVVTHCVVYVHFRSSDQGGQGLSIEGKMSHSNLSKTNPFSALSCKLSSLQKRTQVSLDLIIRLDIWVLLQALLHCQQCQSHLSELVCWFSPEWLHGASPQSWRQMSYKLTWEWMLGNLP